MRILFAEDDHQMSSAVINLIERFYASDIEVVHRPDGDLAFDKFVADGKFDLVVTDLQMPRETGLWLAKQIRKRDEKIPIVLWTGALGIPAHDEWMFNKILDKGFNHLLDTVGEYYNKWKESKDV